MLPLTRRTSATLRSLARPAAWLEFRRKRWWLVAALAIYTLAGFLLLPWVAQEQLTARLGQLLDRPVAVQDVNINPYALSAEVLGFAITEDDGTPIAGFERLYLNFQLRSLWHRAWTFREIALEQPSAELVRFGDGEFNFQRLLPEPVPEEQPGEPGPLPRMIVDTLRIASGNLGFRDDTRAEPFATRLTPIHLALDNLSTVPGLSGANKLTVLMEKDVALTITGAQQLNPLSVTGSIALNGPLLPVVYRYFSDLVNFRVASGHLQSGLNYTLARGGDGLELVLTAIEAEVSQLSLVAKDSGAALADAGALTVSGEQFHWSGRRLALTSVSLADATLNLQRLADNSLNLQHLLVTPDQASPDVGASQDRGEPQTPAADWQLSLAQLRVDNLAVNFEDLAVADAQPLAVDGIALAVNGLNNSAQSAFPLSLQARVAEQGRLAANGELRLLPTPEFRAELTIADLPLIPAQPYLDTAINILIQDGNLNLQSTIASTAEDIFSARGELAIDNLELVGKRQKRQLLGWRQARAEAFAFSAGDTTLDIDALVFDTPYLRLRVNQDQSTNLSRLVVRAETAESSPQPAAGFDTEPSPPPTDTPPFVVRIGKTLVKDGEADFSDRSLPIPFATHIVNLQGEASRFDITSAEPVTLALEGQVDTYGMARVKGSLLALDPTANTNLQLVFRNVDLPNLTPYSVKFAGRQIADGRLSLDLNYRLQQGKMVGDNKVVIFDLELGDKVAYEGAMDLPLNLAVALLKDAEGKIDVDLPVEGDLNNPEFRIGPVIGKALANLITRAVTAPFRLLGALVGMDSSAMSQIEFAPGTADLTPPEKEKLHKLAAAMTQRPQLLVEVPGVYAEADDSRALRETRVDAAIAAAIAANPDDRPQLEKQRQVLESLHAARLPQQPLADLRAAHRKPANPEDPEGPQVMDDTAYLAALRRQLVAAEEISRADLDALATARAMAVRTELVASALESERIAVQPNTTGNADNQGWIPLELGMGSL